MFDVTNILAAGGTLDENTVITIYLTIIMEQENITSNRIGCRYMKFGMIYLFSCSAVLVRIQNYLKNDFDKCKFELASVNLGNDKFRFYRSMVE